MSPPLHRALLYFHTLRYLKPTQIGYQCYYAARSKFYNPVSKYRELYASHTRAIPVKPIELETGLSAEESYTDRSFTFLNQTRSFPESIEWSPSTFGRLWDYNLNYFDYLNQESLDANEGLSLIREFIKSVQENRTGFEPYPISLRCLNWIKFLARTATFDDQQINHSLYCQYHVLMQSIEYHLMGNHLLENGFSLLFGAHYFNDLPMYRKAKEILTEQLQEQILDDGGHFELSPMYHQIILHRILDCVNLTKHNSLFGNELSDLFAKKAEKMLGWLKAITFENGDIPLMNDSASRIAPTTDQLNSYVEMLGLSTASPTIKTNPLSDSGYRKIRRSKYEIVIDVGNIGPDYIPGHAHSDTLSFVLHVRGKAFIVDTGISTYEKNSMRQYERSTRAHNTVMVDNYDQSEIWDGFRVAKRARITQIEEGPDRIFATHDGYRRIGVLHTRTFNFKDDGILIEDRVRASKDFPCHAYLHFHPDLDPVSHDRSIEVGGVRILFEGALDIRLEESHYAPEFNKRIPSKVAIIQFQKNLTTEIIL